MIGVDNAALRDVYAQPRDSQRWSITDDATERRIAAVLDRRLPLDPLYPTRQRVRTRYFAPHPAPAAQSRFVRLREYLGALEPGDVGAPRSTVIEVKRVLEDGRKRKERIPVAVDLLERLRRLPPHVALELEGRQGSALALGREVAGVLAVGVDVEQSIDYGRRSWEHPSGTLRVTLDRVGPHGAALTSDNVARRVLEVKSVGPVADRWLTTTLAQESARGGIARIVPGSGTAPIADAAYAIVGATFRAR